MFEMFNKDGLFAIRLKDKDVVFDTAQGCIEAGLKVGKIEGAGEYEIGEATITGYDRGGAGVAYRVNIGEVSIGVLGAIDEELDDFGMVDYLVSSVAKAVQEVDPKAVVALAGAEEMAKVLDVAPVTEKKIKVKNKMSVPVTLTLYQLV